MQKVDGFTEHVQHREAKYLLRQWKEDVTRWHDEQQRVAGTLEAIRTAWEKAKAALEDHARKIQRFEEHLARHEEELRKTGWPVGEVEDESMVSEHQNFQRALADASTAHKKMQTLYAGVWAEAFELLKLTHPDAVVLETNA